jgi:hypothetical protein
MTKNKKMIVFAGLMIGAFVFFFFNKKVPESFSEHRPPNSPLQIDDTRQVIDLKRKPITLVPKSSTYSNHPSPEWRKRLELSLKAQSGNSIKNIKIQKEKSLIWMRDKNPILVESVIITLTNHQKSESSFRALVDSQTGKVLESWDRTIFDPANVREKAGIHLDPRYSN